MPKPTLLEPGNLVLRDDDASADSSAGDVVPIDHIVDLIRRRMPEFGGEKAGSHVFVIRSKTGSGKSTVLPAYVFRLLRDESAAPGQRLTGPGVICTQPRVLTAQTLARDQAADPNYPDLVLGKTVGYQTGPLSEMPARGLIYATAGTLLAQLRNFSDADIMARYRFIIIDEAHERALDIDVMLLLLKKFLERNADNPRLPFLILASATIPVEKYARYFDVPPAHVIEVEGRAYGVTPHWSRVGTNDYMKAAAETAVRLHVAGADDDPLQSDILIFLPGAAELDKVQDLLREANAAFRGPASQTPPFIVLEIKSEIIVEQGRDYQLLKVPPERLPGVPATDGKTILRPRRRIIVSTVVAETGITLETLKYVIDAGWSRVTETYFPGRYRGLITRPAPKSRIEQRMGRAGRKFPGEFYPLYTKNVYESLPREQLPEIVVEGVGPRFLDVVAATADESGVFRVENINMLDAPPALALACTIEEAAAFGYIEDAFADEAGTTVVGQRLTRLGEAASRLARLAPAMFQTIAAGFLWGASIQDLVFIVSLYDSRKIDLFETPLPGPGAADEAAKIRRAAIAAGLPAEIREALGTDIDAEVQDDFIAALIAFEGFAKAAEESNGDISRLLAWCEENRVDFDGAAALAGVRDEVINEILVAGLNPFWGSDNRLLSAVGRRDARATFRDRVVTLKHCIWAGLRFNSVERRPVAPGAARLSPRPVSLIGDAVGVAGGGAGATPFERAVTNTIRLRPARREPGKEVAPLIYELQAGLVSVQDGFVAPDPELLDPRMSAGHYSE